MIIEIASLPVVGRIELDLDEVGDLAAVDMGEVTGRVGGDTVDGAELLKADGRVEVFVVLVTGPGVGGNVIRSSSPMAGRREEMEVGLYFSI